MLQKARSAVNMFDVVGGTTTTTKTNNSRAANPWPAPFCSKSEQSRGGSFERRESSKTSGFRRAIKDTNVKSSRSDAFGLNDTLSEDSPPYVSNQASRNAPGPFQGSGTRSEAKVSRRGGRKKAPLERRDSALNVSSNMSDAKLENENALGLYCNGYSYENEKKLSESLEKILMLDDTPSPRGLTRNRRESIGRAPFVVSPSPMKARAGASLCREREKTKAEPKQVQKARKAKVEPVRVISEDVMVIETRRTIHRQGDIEYEETTTIQFPKNLPPNVHVVTAQFPPISRH